jgi:hypothetical protein
MVRLSGQKKRISGKLDPVNNGESHYDWRIEICRWSVMRECMIASSLLQTYLDRILKARVYEVAVQTPLEVAPRLSRRLGAQVLLKREDQQPVFSFKIRGAYNRMRQLTAEERAQGDHGGRGSELGRRGGVVRG